VFFQLQAVSPAPVPGSGHFPACTHSRYCATVTSVRSMRNAAAFTEEPGFSSLHGASPVALHPMKNGPAGTATISAGRGSATFVVADASGSGPGGAAAVGACSGSGWVRPTTTSTATPTHPTTT